MRIGFDSILEKFGSMGEKTGWTYIKIPLSVTAKLMPGTRKSFRVKGLLDEHSIKAVALIPMGEGQFIMPINASMRKAIRKNIGATITGVLELDAEPIPLSSGLLECLQDEPDALKNFTDLLPSHQQYYSKWIESAKTEVTKVKRIGVVVNGLARGLDFGTMLREERDKKFIR